MRCSICGATAARFSALDAGEGAGLGVGRARLERTKWFGTCELPMSHERAKAWIRRIECEPLLDLAREERDLFGFVCRRCGVAYCAHCWRVGPPEMEDGYYDRTRGTCPLGHEQTLDD